MLINLADPAAHGRAAEIDDSKSLISNQGENHIFASGDLEKCLPWHFSRRKDENVVFAFLHFQSLAVIENGGASLRRAGTSIIRGALQLQPLYLESEPGWVC